MVSSACLFTKIDFYSLLLAFLLIQIQSSKSDDSIFVKNLASNNFNDTKFCASILLPTAISLKKSLEASFIQKKNGTHLNEQENLDLCCRLLYKCDAYQKTELKYSFEWNIMHCECENKFRICLKNLNTSSSKQFAYIYSIHKKKCYANNYQIIKCVKFETFLLPEIQFYNASLNRIVRETFYNRCIEYEFDESKSKQLQLFDLPFSSDRILSFNVDAKNNLSDVSMNSETSETPITTMPPRENIMTINGENSNKKPSLTTTVSTVSDEKKNTEPPSGSKQLSTMNGKKFIERSFEIFELLVDSACDFAHKKYDAQLQNMMPQIDPRYGQRVKQFFINSFNFVCENKEMFLDAVHMEEMTTCSSAKISVFGGQNTFHINRRKRTTVD